MPRTRSSAKVKASSVIDAENGRAAAETSASRTVTDYVDVVRHGNCIELMAAMPPQCIDLVITDPPFAIEFQADRANYNRKGNRVLEGYNEIQATDYQSFTTAWLEQATRLLKPSGSMYIFSGWNHLKEILIAIEQCALTLVNHLIWKYQFGVVTRRKYVTSHYHCLYVCKDDRYRQFYPYARYAKEERTRAGGSAHYKDKEDVWSINREYWSGDKKTPTKLPAELIRKILAYSSQPGDVVLDPFLGSGQVAVVSRMEGRRFVGFEIVREYYEFALQRIKSGQYRIKVDADERDSVPANRQMVLWT